MGAHKLQIKVTIILLEAKRVLRSVTHAVIKSSISLVFFPFCKEKLFRPKHWFYRAAAAAAAVFTGSKVTEK